MQDDLVDFGRLRRLENQLQSRGIDFGDTRRSLAGDRAGSRLLLRACAGDRGVVLCLGGTRGFQRGPGVGLRFVVALQRDQAFLVERVQALVGLVCKLGGGGGLVPHRLGDADVFGPRTDVDQIALGIRGGLRRPGLRDLGAQLRTVQRGQHGTGRDGLSFAHRQRRDPRRNLGRDVDGLRLDLALQRHRRRMIGEPEAPADERQHAQQDQKAGHPGGGALSGRRRGQSRTSARFMNSGKRPIWPDASSRAPSATTNS